MNHQTTTTPDGSLGFFFPQSEPLKPLTKDDFSKIKFRGERTDLEVYHLAYGTKKLRKCTYSRMKKRQARINKKKAKMLIVKSPEEKMAKANKEAWLRNIQEVVSKENLKTTQALVRKKFGRKIGKKKRKHHRSIKNKIQAAKATEMKD